MAPRMHNHVQSSASGGVYAHSKSALRHPFHAPQSRLHRRHRPDSRPRHRRQHRHLLRRLLRPAPPAPLSQSCRTTLPRRIARTISPDRFGAILLPRFPRLAACIEDLCVARRLWLRRLHPRHGWRAKTRAGHKRHREFLLHARCENRAWPRLRGWRRQTRRASSGHPQRRLLAHRLRRPGRRCRQHDPPRRQPVTIVGVLPRNFEFAQGNSAPLWVPLHPSGGLGERRSLRWLNVVGRLAPGVTPDQAKAEMTGIAAQLAHAYPKENDSISVVLSPFRERIVGKVRPLLLVLLGAVGFVLLIACANVANLLLTRSI